MQNKYEVLGVVGEGAYGIVYKCKNKETGKYVAIKKFKEVGDELVKKTMKRELKMLQRLHHPNVVDFQDAFKRKGNLFLVFEFVDKNLLELLQEHPNGLEPSLIRSLIYQICKSIKYLHDQNIIHRDIKPENLLITENMESKLCDFGFARLISGTCSEKLTDYVATRWYRAPELLLTQGEYGKEVDYWAIGCIMGELVDGNPMFPGENELDQIHCIQKVLGNLTDEQVDMFYSNPLFNGKNLLNVTKPETIEKKYLGKLSKKAISFLKGLLALDPKKRLNGNTVFKHPYFEKLVEQDMKKEKENGINKLLLGNNSNYNNEASNVNNINNTNHNFKEEMSYRNVNDTNNNIENNNNTISKKETSCEKINIKQVSHNNSNKNIYKTKSSPDNIQNNPSFKNLNINSNPTNITNINIINYNNYEDNRSQGSNMNTNNIQSNSSNNTNSNFSNNNNNNKNIKKKDMNPNSISMKKCVNKMATSINFNQKNNNNMNFVSFVSSGGINSINQINSNNTILDNAYKTFYKKNKEKDIYNIELDLQNCVPSDSNDNMKNYMQGRKYDVINEEEEFTTEEKIKLKQLASLYKNENVYQPKKNNTCEKNGGKNIKFHQKSSPNKTNYYHNQNKTGYKNGFHLPVIPKGSIYNNGLYGGHSKKYGYH